jgi:hypothetical protein
MSPQVATVGVGDGIGGMTGDAGGGLGTVGGGLGTTGIGLGTTGTGLGTRGGGLQAGECYAQCQQLHCRRIPDKCIHMILTLKQKRANQSLERPFCKRRTLAKNA